jgi:hypothetical protein
MNQNKHVLMVTLCISFLIYSSSNFATSFTSFDDMIMEWEQKEKRNKIAILNYQIDAIKNEHYQKILTELQRITNKPYDDLKKEIDEQRNLTKTLLQQENHHANHDPNIPNSITQKLCETISQHNINPNNINFAYKNSNSLHASAYSGNMYAGSWIDKPKIINKPEITIYDPLLKESEDSQLQTYHHEICHILLQHIYIDTLANKKLPNIILEETTTEPYTASETYYKKKGISHLASLTEEEADIHASLSNSQIAYIGMQKRCSDRQHPHIIDKQNHCKKLTTIYELMKQKEKLMS